MIQLKCILYITVDVLLNDNVSSLPIWVTVKQSGNRSGHFFTMINIPNFKDIFVELIIDITSLECNSFNYRFFKNIKSRLCVDCSN